MNRLFGTSKKNEPKLDDSISAINKRIEDVEVKIAKLEAEKARYLEQYKKTRGSSKEMAKQRASRTIQQIRLYEKQRDAWSSQIWNLEGAQMSIDTMNHTTTMVTSMEKANKQMSSLNAKMNIDKIEDLRDMMEDNMEQANMVQEALGRTYDMPDDISDAELEQELAALDDELAFADEEPISYVEPEVHHATADHDTAKAPKQGDQNEPLGL